jgi:hypothetical protein
MIGRCHECARNLWDLDEFERTSLGPLCLSCSEALVQPEVVSPKLIRLYRRVQEDEARRAVRPLASGIHVGLAPLRPADPVISKR